MELEQEVEHGVGQSASEGVLEVHFVALDHLVGVFAAPEQQHPDEVVLQHGNHGVSNVSLFLGQGGIQVLLVALGQLLDDDGRVGDFLSIDLDEWQLSLLGAQLQLVVDVLQGGEERENREKLVNDSSVVLKR